MIHLSIIVSFNNSKYRWRSTNSLLFSYFLEYGCKFTLIKRDKNRWRNHLIFLGNEGNLGIFLHAPSSDRPNPISTRIEFNAMINYGPCKSNFDGNVIKDPNYSLLIDTCFFLQLFNATQKCRCNYDRSGWEDKKKKLFAF